MDVGKASTPQRLAWEALPSLAAVATWMLEIPVEKWLAYLGLVFLVLQIAGYVWRLRRDMKREARESAFEHQRSYREPD